MLKTHIIDNTQPHRRRGRGSKSLKEPRSHVPLKADPSNGRTAARYESNNRTSNHHNPPPIDICQARAEQGPESETQRWNGEAPVDFGVSGVELLL